MARKPKTGKQKKTRKKNDKLLPSIIIPQKFLQTSEKKANQIIRKTLNRKKPYQKPGFRKIGNVSEEIHNRATMSDKELIPIIEKAIKEDQTGIPFLIRTSAKMPAKDFNFLISTNPKLSEMLKRKIREIKGDVAKIQKAINTAKKANVESIRKSIQMSEEEFETILKLFPHLRKMLERKISEIQNKNIKRMQKLKEKRKKEFRKKEELILSPNQKEAIKKAAILKRKARQTNNLKTARMLLERAINILKKARLPKRAAKVQKEIDKLAN